MENIVLERVHLYCYIYALVDSHGRIRYVGKATDPYHRLYAHLERAAAGHRSHTANWLRTLSHRPRIVILEAVEFCRWQLRERFWISALRRKGYDLTNTTQGGEGGATYGRLGKGWSKDQHRKYAATRIGMRIKQSPSMERTRAIRAAWDKRKKRGSVLHSAKTKAKMATSHRAVWAARRSRKDPRWKSTRK